jgi:hypothetical protein
MTNSVGQFVQEEAPDELAAATVPFVKSTTQHHGRFRLRQPCGGRSR